ncbi:MAG: Rab family GTPase [Candidatus Hodarchaeales archaeon]
MSSNKSVKVVIAGEKRVGKSSLVHRFIHEQFPLKDLYSTVGFDFTVKSVKLDDGAIIDVHLFDFGGEPRFRMIFPQYASDCDGLILAFDPTREQTFIALHEWIKVYGRESESINFLVSTKADLGVAISPVRINEFRNHYDIDEYFSTSAITGKNTQELLQKLVRRIIEVQNNYK